MIANIYKNCYHKPIGSDCMIKEIKIELTEECHRQCIHCSSDAKKKNFSHLPFSIVQKIIDEAKELHVEKIVFTGGEATLYPQIKEAVAYAKENGMDVTLYSMCDPTKENINLLKELKTIGLKEIIYSLSYQLTRDHVITLEKLKDFFQQILSVVDLPLGFHYVITKETYQDIDKIVDFCFSLDQKKTKSLSFLRFVPHGRGEKHMKLDRKEQLMLQKKFLQLKQRYKEKIRLGSPWNYLGIEYTPCTAATKTMIVGFDGNVYPCDAMKYFDYCGIGGNIYQNSLKEIYHSSYFKAIQEAFEVSEECQACVQFSICHSGCLGQKIIDFMEDQRMTFTNYQEKATRTMNHFQDEKTKKQNGEMGIIGEIGELIDSFKKYKTHDLNKEAKQKIIQNLSIEIGDILWYLAASLSSFYHFSFEDIGHYLQKETTTSTYFIDQHAIKQSMKRKDPDCPYSQKKQEIPLSIVDQIKQEPYDFDQEWKNLVNHAYQIITTTEKNKVIEECSKLLLSLTQIAHHELNTTIEEIAKKNIEKLNHRYQSGFDPQIASSRVDLLTDYKQKEPQKKYIYQP